MAWPERRDNLVFPEGTTGGLTSGEGALQIRQKLKLRHSSHLGQAHETVFLWNRLPPRARPWARWGLLLQATF